MGEFDGEGDIEGVGEADLDGSGERRCDASGDAEGWKRDAAWVTAVATPRDGLAARDL